MRVEEAVDTSARTEPRPPLRHTRHRTRRGYPRRNVPVQECPKGFFLTGLFWDRTIGYFVVLSLNGPV